MFVFDYEVEGQYNGIDWSTPPESFFKNGVMAITGINKYSNIEVDIKVYSKKDMIMQEIESLRDQISLYSSAIHDGVI